MKKLFFTYFCLAFNELHTVAQNSSLINYIRDGMEHIYGNLDTNQIPTRILYDKAVPFSNLRFLNQQNDTILNTLRNWKQIYTELYNGSIGKPFIPNLQSFLQNADLFIKNDIIPIGIIFLDYNKIKSYTLDSHLLKLNIDSSYSDVKGRKESPYETKTVFSMSPLKNFFYHGRVKFYYGEDFIISKNKQKLRNILMDFGDGSGFKNVKFGDTISVNYSDKGNKIITAKINSSNKTNGSFINSSSFNVRYSPWYIAPDKTLNFEADIPYPVEGGEKAKGRAHIRYGIMQNGIPLQAKKLTNPVIFVEGIDFKDGCTSWGCGEFGWIEFFNGGYNPGGDNYIQLTNLPGFVDELYKNDFDLILLDFEKGADDMQRNAFLLVKLLQWVNDPANKTGCTPNVVIATSMGGQVAKYALAYMEKNHLPHCTNLYVSFDSPHQGANIPLGLQYWLAYFSSENASAEEFYNSLNKNGAQQMMVYHIASANIPGSSDLRSVWLNDLNDVGIYPQHLRKIAIANGNKYGQQLFNGGANLISWEQDWGLVDGEAWALPGAFSDHYIFHGDIPGKDEWIVYIENPSEVLHYDNAPGGTNDALRILGDMEPSIGNIITVIDEACFIPTVSALDVKMNSYDLFLNVDNYLPNPNNPDPNKTPFERFYATSSNSQLHITIDDVNATLSNAKFLIDELKFMKSHTPDCHSFYTYNYGDKKARYLSSTTVGSISQNYFEYIYLNANKTIGRIYSPVQDKLPPLPVEGSTFTLETCFCKNEINIELGQFVLGEVIDATTINKAIVNLNEGTVFTIATGSQLIINPGSSFVVKDNAVLIIEGDIYIKNGGSLFIQRDGSVFIKSSANIHIENNGLFDFKNGSYACFQQDIHYFLSTGSRINIAQNANMTGIKSGLPVVSSGCMEFCNLNSDCSDGSTDTPTPITGNFSLFRENPNTGAVDDVCKLSIAAHEISHSGDVYHEWIVTDKNTSAELYRECFINYPVDDYMALYGTGKATFESNKTYLVTLRLYNICGAFTDVTKEISTGNYYSTSIWISYSSGDLREGTPVALTAKNTNDFDSFYWVFWGADNLLNGNFSGSELGAQLNYDETNLTATQEGTYYLIGVGGCGYSSTNEYVYDSVFVSDCPYLAKAGYDNIICSGGCVGIGINKNDYPSIPKSPNIKDKYYWEPNENVSNPISSYTEVSPDQTTTYTLVVFNANYTCYDIDSVKITVDPSCNINDCNAMANAGPDQSICPGSSVKLGYGGYYCYNNPPISYELFWSPVTGLSNPYIAQPYTTVSNNTTYTLTVRKINGGHVQCTDQDMVKVSVLSKRDCPVRVDDEAVICSKPPLQNYQLIRSEEWLNRKEFISGTLEVPSGKTLTIINSELAFGYCARILVRVGGTVNVNGTTLKGCKGDFTWIGIEVEGNPMLAQTPEFQGTLIMENSKISGAETAVLIGKRNDTGEIDLSYGGGIVKLKNNEFSDNKSHLEFTPYDRPNQSVVENNQFREKRPTGNSDCIHPTGGGGPEKPHIRLREVKEVKIMGNYFDESATTGIWMDKTNDMRVTDNTIKSDTAIRVTEAREGNTFSTIAQNKFYGTVNLYLKNSNLKRLDITCNEFHYSQYGIYSESNLLKDQGSKAQGAGNTFVSLESVPRLNHQLYHNGTGAVMTYYYDPSRPVTLQTDANLRANAVKSQRDNVCLNRTARVAETKVKEEVSSLHVTLEEFNIYPNPAPGIFKVIHTLEENTPALFEIADLRGKKMLSIPASQLQSNSLLNLTLLPPGVYIYRVRNGENVISRGRLVVVY